jgi:hypothetical protein
MKLMDCLILVLMLATIYNLELAWSNHKRLRFMARRYDRRLNELDEQASIERQQLSNQIKEVSVSHKFLIADHAIHKKRLDSQAFQLKVIQQAHSRLQETVDELVASSIPKDTKIQEAEPVK